MKRKKAFIIYHLLVVQMCGKLKVSFFEQLEEVVCSDVMCHVPLYLCTTCAPLLPFSHQ